MGINRHSVMFAVHNRCIQQILVKSRPVDARLAGHCVQIGYNPLIDQIRQPGGVGNADVRSVAVAHGGNQLGVVFRPDELRVLHLDIRVAFVEFIDQLLHVVPVAAVEQGPERKVDGFTVSFTFCISPCAVVRRRCGTAACVAV
ncbi:hypothetical protein D3C75_832280 [compost metagenome]